MNITNITTNNTNTTNITIYQQTIQTQTQTIQNLNNILILATIIIIALIIFIYIYIKIIKKEQERKYNNIPNIEQKIKEYTEKLEALNQKERTKHYTQIKNSNLPEETKQDLTTAKYFPEIRVSDLPQDIQDTLLRKDGLFSIFSDKKESEITEPVLFLMMNNGTAEIKQNVKEGQLPLNTPDGKTKWLNISYRKTYKLRHGKKLINVMFGHENEAELYPHEPEHYSKAFYDIVQALQLNKGNLQSSGFKLPKWLIPVALLAILAIIGYSIFFKPSTTAETIAQNATTITNITHNITQNITRNITTIYT